MRASLLTSLVLFPLIIYAQRNNSELVNIVIDNQPLDVILDSVSIQTNYFFSYNADVFPAGSRYSITAKDEPIDQFLSRLLVGTRLKYSFFKDQIILNYQPPEEIVVRKKNFFTISGKVRDENGNAVSQVNIFLDGTNLGTFSDIDGNFRLEAIPPGFYDIVFSHIGFENGSYQISEYNGGARIQNHQLKDSFEELQDVTVTASRIRKVDLEWQTHYQTFRAELLGNSKKSQSCVIENPEVISFIYDKDQDELSVFAEDAIVIRNDALGYRIDYYLESFKKETNDLRFRGKIRFRNQPPVSGKEKRQWKKNRKESYYGSFNHFKKALLSGTLSKEGFKIFSSNSLRKVKKKELTSLTERDILVYKGNGYELNFDKNLVVEYRREKESLDFLNTSNFVGIYYQELINEDGLLVKDPENQTSVIRLLRRPVRIDNSGQIVDKFALTTYGYWAWERLASLVPINYEPKWDNL